MSGEHLDLPSAQPPDKLWDDSCTSTEGDGVGHVSKVRFKSGGDVNGPQSSLEAGDFEATGNELMAELLLPGATGIELLAGGQGVVVYGGDESIGDSVDCFINEAMSGCVWRRISAVRGDTGGNSWSFSWRAADSLKDGGSCSGITTWGSWASAALAKVGRRSPSSTRLGMLSLS